MSLVLDEHRQYLADRARVGAFDAALRGLVKPGDVVLDLASGTGILGLLACRAGAARVYAIESESIVGIARQLARDNGFADRITCIQDHSTRASLPEPVDLIVTDLAGRFGFEAGLIETLADARHRFLKPGGRLIPSAVTLWVAPVEATRARRHIDFWSGPISGLTFAAASATARCTGYPCQFAEQDLLADGVTLTSVDLTHDIRTMSGSVEFVVRCARTLDGLGGWFSAVLAPGVELTNAPGAPNRINRRNVFFPLHDSVSVQAGDTVTASMFIRPESLMVRWRVAVRRQGGIIHETDASTFEGMLVSQERLERTRPAFQPALTEAGRARRTVLELCDGVRAVHEIERGVFERHRSLFASASDAAAFVAEVVTTYSV